jgi:chromosomal replication initiator protein
MNPEQAWQAALGELQLQLTKATFDTWVKNTHVVSCEDGTYLIGVHNAYAKDWLENRLLTTIKRTLTGIVGRTVEVKFVVRQRTTRETKPDAILAPSICEQTVEAPPTFTTNLNPKHTFGTFVVGNSNRLANAAAQAVADNPGKAYNPLFIYGGVGLGKTHLLQAIGNAALRRTSRILYISSETFTNELINGIRTQSTDAFRLKYRDNVDVLMIDDIQFIGGKESTQEELFHTFNTLHEAGKQIVISSDRPPRAIVTLEDRLRSRFEWGLIADIQPPDLETRIAILRAKAESQPLHIRPEVIDFIAGKFQTNIRELEGALNRVTAWAQLMNIEVTTDVAASALEDILARSDTITADQVLEAVAHQFGIDIATLRGRQRAQKIAAARHVAMYLLKEDLHYSFPQVGEVLGGRDHTTALYACGKIAEEIEVDDQLRRDVLAVREYIYKEPVTSRRR